MKKLISQNLFQNTSHYTNHYKLNDLEFDNYQLDKYQLNEYQLEAIKMLNKPLLVLAGPGTGKTTTITYKTLFLLKTQNLKPEEILLLTFTNKAAEEMQKRIKKILNQQLPYIGTFHSIIIKLLKEIIPIKTSLYKLENKINIIDEDDKLEIIKNILNKSKSKISPYNLSNIISSIKNKKNISLKEETYNLVEEYNFFLKKINCLDFDDIILCINNIFTEREDIRKKVASKFKYIIVDEFQDINLTQFEFLKNLTQENKNIFVVGDDDQSIYAFRNACVQIMLEFPKHYPNTQIINLQYNYRSPEIIIKKYSKLISFNTLRYPKKIESIFSKQGKPKQGKFEIKILKTEEEEYNYISSIIKNYQNQNKSITILTRTNEICKIFEKNLLKNGINAKFISGYDFFQRKEIKDILSFLKVINNPADDISLIRILQNIFKLKKSEMKYLINQSSEENLINIISREKYEIFEIIQNFITENEKNSNPLEIIKKIYTSYIPKNNTTDIFINFAENFFRNNPELTLENFLNYILLIKSNNESKIDQNPQKVLIMTMHSCKGLEFDIVFVSRVNQGIIPHYKTSKEEEEEERRLLYVAMSRAKEALYITSTIPPSNFILPLIP